MPRTLSPEIPMSRALLLAKKGLGFVSPNPLVGCVIVDSGKVIAEGWHRKHGGPHAEIEALKKIKNKTSLKNATAYVTLEPCDHTGKTGPCTDTLIASGIKRVVVGMKDPNPLVAGKGIKKLRAAGIEVTLGVLEKECQALNEIFTKWITTQRPFVLLKAAVTLDGALTFRKGTRSDFSSPESYKRVHAIRQQYDAIAIGSNTMATDNPLLTTRGVPHARNPVRVIFDTHLRTPPDARLLGQKGKTIIFVGPNMSERKMIALAEKNITHDVVMVESPLQNGHVSLSYALHWLGQHQITSVMVEGGGTIASALLSEGLVDKMMISFTPYFAKDPAAPRLFQGNLGVTTLERVSWETIGPDGWMMGYLRRKT